MLKLIRLINKLGIDNAVRVLAKVLDAKSKIERAAPGSEVDADEVRGLRLFGRIVDMPLKFHVR